MKRKEFLKNSSVIALSLGLFPTKLLSFEKKNICFSEDELMGIGKIDLVSGIDYKMRKLAANAFEKMRKKAKTDGINIRVVSSFRSFDHQKRIWERKYNKFTKAGMSSTKAVKKIIEYSTIPGTSRHHWGTEIDIVDGSVTSPRDSLNTLHYEKGGAYHKMKLWLNDNAENFGFHETYTNHPERKGFKYEPWHFSYAPLSIPMLEEYKRLDIRRRLKEIKLIGSESFSEEFIGNYIKENILDINPSLL